jgi:hypothetical protein
MVEEHRKLYHKRAGPNARAGFTKEWAEWSEVKLGNEFQLNDFVSFMWGWLPLPLAQCVLGTLHQHRMAALDVHRFDLPIGSDGYFGFHISLDGHRSRQAGILRDDPIHNFSIDIPCILRRSRRRNQQQDWHKIQSGCNPVLHGNTLTGFQDKSRLIYLIDYEGNM